MHGIHIDQIKSGQEPCRLKLKLKQKYLMYDTNNLWKTRIIKNNNKFDFTFFCN